MTSTRDYPSAGDPDAEGPAADWAALAAHSLMSHDDALAAVALQRGLLPTALPDVVGIGAGGRGDHAQDAQRAARLCAGDPQTRPPRCA